MSSRKQMLKNYQNELRDTRAVLKELEWTQSVCLLKRQYFFKVFGLTIKSSAVVTKIFASALVVICCPDVLDLTRLNVRINVKLITPI